MSTTYITPKTDWDGSDYTNFEDLNRVENNTQYVYEKLLQYGYYATAPILKTWVDGEPVFNDDLNRMENNIKQLAEAYFTNDEFQQLKIDWETLDPVDFNFNNRVEKDLEILDMLINSMSKYFVKCGVAKCGQSHLWQNRFRKY